jgi:hypothetical protein
MRRLSLRAQTALVLVTLDFIALAAMVGMAMWTNYPGRHLFEAWSYLHWPTSTILDSLIGSRSVHDPQLLTISLSVLAICLLHTAAVGWGVGRILEIFQHKQAST